MSPYQSALSGNVFRFGDLTINIVNSPGAQVILGSIVGNGLVGAQAAPALPPQNWLDVRA